MSPMPWCQRGRETDPLTICLATAGSSKGGIGFGGHLDVSVTETYKIRWMDGWADFAVRRETGKVKSQRSFVVFHGNGFMISCCRR